MWRFDVGGTELYDARARMWSPALGNFLSVDEFVFHDENSTLWSWPRQNPIRWSDPSGNVPGVPYASRDEAAVEAARWIWSEKAGSWTFEFDAAIYSEQTASGTRFFHTDPEQGSRKYAHPPQSVGIPAGAVRQAHVHTHPPKSDKGETSINHCSWGDKTLAQESQLPQYLGAPNGDVRLFSAPPSAMSTDDAVRLPDVSIGRTPGPSILWWSPSAE